MKVQAEVGGGIERAVARRASVHAVREHLRIPHHSPQVLPERGRHLRPGGADVEVRHPQLTYAVGKGANGLRGLVIIFTVSLNPLRGVGGKAPVGGTRGGVEQLGHGAQAAPPLCELGFERLHLLEVGGLDDPVLPLSGKGELVHTERGQVHRKPRGEAVLVGRASIAQEEGGVQLTERDAAHRGDEHHARGAWTFDGLSAVTDARIVGFGDGGAAAIGVGVCAAVGDGVGLVAARRPHLPEQVRSRRGAPRHEQEDEDDEDRELGDAGHDGLQGEGNEGIGVHAHLSKNLAFLQIKKSHPFCIG